MLILPTQRQQVVFLGIVASIAVNGCSKPAASAAGNPTVTDSTATSVPTTATASISASSATPAPAMQSSDAPPKPTKPSIDGGRKPGKSAIIPRQAAKPSPDSSARATSAPATGQDSVLKYDAATNTVTFQLIAGPFNFNGFTSGGATLTLTPKANVVINFVNKDGTPHSAQVISGDGPIPNAATDPAIPRAYTNKVLEGLPQEGSDVMRFPVPQSGKYRIFCGVPGHGLSGMWIWMTIDPAAKAPSFGPTKS